MEDKIVKAGTKIVIGMDAGMAGTDAMSPFVLRVDYSGDELGDIAWQMGLNHAENYGVYPLYELEGMSEEELAEVDENDYSDNIGGWWELYDAEKHDGHITYGNESPHFQEL
jgi:hypothetical protein